MVKRLARSSFDRAFEGRSDSNRMVGGSESGSLQRLVLLP